MKRCTRCEREIPDSATSCGLCGEVRAAATPAPAVQATPASGPGSVPVPASVPSSIQDYFDSIPGSIEEAVAPLDMPVAQTVVPPPVAVATPAKAGRSNRGMMIAAAVVVVAGGTLTFAMFRSSAPAVPVATPAARPNPAAAKPAAAKPTPVANAVAPGAAPVTASPAAVPTKWRPANKEWLLNARRGVAFELPSQNRVTIWHGIAQPMLVVRCDAGRLQTFVYTASAIQMEAVDENHTVRVSFDDEPEATERWADSSDHDALFAPDGAAFALRLLTSRKLRVSYTPHNAQRAVVEFQTAGLDDLIAPAAKQCGWKK